MMEVRGGVSRAFLKVQVTGRPGGGWGGGSHHAVCIWTFYVASGATDMNRVEDQTSQKLRVRTLESNSSATYYLTDQGKLLHLA